MSFHRSSTALGVIVVALCITAQDTTAQQDFQPNYNEARVPSYTLPDPLTMEDGRTVDSPALWSIRRAELLELFSENVYGRTPDKEIELDITVTQKLDGFLEGMASLREYRLSLPGTEPGISINLLLVVPAHACTKEPVPVFLGLNFSGNHSIHASPAIALTESWMRSTQDTAAVVNNRATEAGRAIASERWPLETIIRRGYGLATAYYGDIDPDFHDGFKNGIHPYFQHDDWAHPSPTEWGSIGAWAWGLSRMADALQTVPCVDPSRLVVFGHSRLGKAALWAGVQDERFQIVISNNSGCGGAALNRREYGETVGRITSQFPHWFCQRYADYADQVDQLPVDQHQLIALIAPRPVYVASATQDLWADPRGEFLAAFHAGPVYELFGRAGLSESMPRPDVSTGDYVGYHLRTGKHNITPFDWERFLDFADRHFRP